MLGNPDGDLWDLLECDTADLPLAVFKGIYLSGIYFYDEPNILFIILLFVLDLLRSSLFKAKKEYKKRVWYIPRYQGSMTYLCIYLQNSFSNNRISKIANNNSVNNSI